MVTVMRIVSGVEVNMAVSLDSILVLNGLCRCVIAREEGEGWILMVCA